MPGIHFDDLTFRYSSAVDLFDHLTVHLGSGWTGVVGENGTGKSTLLRLAAAELRPSSGTVVIDPRGASLVLCPQTVDDLTQQVEDFAASWDGADSALRSRLDLDPADLGRWTTLSPGERKRWQVGAALMVRPEVLLVDEPTNHLDAETRRVLVSALAGFVGAGMVVSHDRALLDRLCRRILRVAIGDVRLWNGDYTTASRGWESDAAEQRTELEALRTQERRMARELADRRRVLEEKQAVRRRQMRQAAGDHDVTSAVATYRAAAAQRAASRGASVLRRKLDKAEDRRRSIAPPSEHGGRVSFAYQPPARRRLLTHQGTLLAGDQVIIEDASVVVERNDRIRLSGRNGAGKSTLLRALVDESDLPPALLLFLPQELDESGRAQARRALLGLEPGERGEVLAIVGSLGTDPERVLATELPSPGEARKLSLALGLARQVWCLVLDEPTNHLDLPSVERMEVALTGFPGAVVLVTHDDWLAAAVTNSEWHIDRGTVTVV
jgi:ATPase subunit of ABC transporter with duplicated ATPase domains